MVYQRIKTINGNRYIYEQKSIRDENGNVKTKHVRYVGKYSGNNNNNLGTTRIKRFNTQEKNLNFKNGKLNIETRTLYGFYRYKDGKFNKTKSINKNFVLLLKSKDEQKIYKKFFKNGYILTITRNPINQDIEIFGEYKKR